MYKSIFSDHPYQKIPSEYWPTNPNIKLEPPEPRMLCPRCNVDMVYGFALVTKWIWGCISRWPGPTTLQKCRKCPKCGHSDDGK